MATEYALERADATPIGSFDDVQGLIRSIFDSVTFAWTQSGPEKIKLAKERGIEFPPALAKSLAISPSLLEGRAAGSGWQISFGLGHSEPVMCLYLTSSDPRNALETQLSALESVIGGTIVICGDEKNRVT